MDSTGIASRVLSLSWRASAEPLVRMFEQALKVVNTLTVERRDELMTRLDSVRVISHKVGYGVGDDMGSLLSKFAPKSL
jgi:hypothetical protein